MLFRYNSSAISWIKLDFAICIFARILQSSGSQPSFLAKTSNQVLMNRVRAKLSDVKAELSTLIGQAQQELKSFTDAAVYEDVN